MHEGLPIGARIKTKYGGTVTVKQYLGEGGQGWVYQVDYNGQEKALKWYKPSGLGGKPEAFYENIDNNIQRGSPSPAFLWPQDITLWQDDSFGYIMDLRKEGYYEITDFMIGHVRFGSFRAATNACMQVVSAFRLLHNGGYCYKDINNGNCFIDPLTGDVQICDNDNVAPPVVDTGIIGTPRFMAPEIVMGGRPDVMSDLFSMSVILYILLCNNHPLEGKRFVEAIWTAENQEKLYGSQPLFMMDPDDKRNRPHKVVHKNTLSIWPYLPDYLQKLFQDAFSQKSLHHPSNRPSEFRWLDALSRFRSEIVPCGCGNEIFYRRGESCRCELCHRKADIPFLLELSEYSIPAIKDSRIYRCQLGVCNPDTALDLIAQVAEKKSTGALWVRNKSGKHWNAVTPKGTPKKVAPGEAIPLKDGISFTAEGETIAIKSK